VIVAVVPARIGPSELFEVWEMGDRIAVLKEMLGKETPA